VSKGTELGTASCDPLDDIHPHGEQTFDEAGKLGLVGTLSV
jgi:hypothetical protein